MTFIKAILLFVFNSLHNSTPIPAYFFCSRSKNINHSILEELGRFQLPGKDFNKRYYYLLMYTPLYLIYYTDSRFTSNQD